MKTEKAWNALYRRLDEERLLPVTKQSAPKAKIVLLSFTSIAAAVLAVIFLAVPRADRQSSAQLLSQSNEDTDFSLVKTLEDQSVVFLTSQSTLRYPRHFEKQERCVELHGEALFDIARNKQCPFTIDTRQIRIQVLGTCFHVKCMPGSLFELGVYRGLVRVTDKRTGRFSLVHAGEKIISERGRFMIRTLLADGINDYQRKMKFKDETLENILRVINVAHPDVTVSCTKAYAHRRLTVAFSDETPLDMCMLLAETLHLGCVRQGRTITIK